MRENFTLAVLYNLFAVPLAITGQVDAADRRAGDVWIVDSGHAERAAARRLRPGGAS